MAQASRKLVIALRDTAQKLSEGSPYQWGHMGSCNCGNLAQTLTNLSKAEIHNFAMERYGDWSEQIREYCPNSGLPIDWIIDEMLRNGLNTQDLINLERLSDDNVLRHLPEGKRYLNKNNRADVVVYLETWANLLAADLQQIQIEDKATA